LGRSGGIGLLHEPTTEGHRQRHPGYRTGCDTAESVAVEVLRHRSHQQRGETVRDPGGCTRGKGAYPAVRSGGGQREYEHPQSHRNGGLQFGAARYGGCSDVAAGQEQKADDASGTDRNRDDRRPGQCLLRMAGVDNCGQPQRQYAHRLHHGQRGDAQRDGMQ
jgi:hypothetical protein